MKTCTPFGYVACCTLVAALIGCAGSQPRIGASGMVPQTVVGRPDHRRSWMSPEAKTADLLYVSGESTGSVYVYTYPAGKLVGTLSGFTAPTGECADKAGHVWIADDTGGDAPGTLIEYAHGGTAPIAQLSDGDPPYNCSVDPTTQNLAVASAFYSDRVAVYVGSRGSPNYYGNVAQTFSCTYDVSGNLFVTVMDGPSSSRLFWLPKGGSSLKRYRLVPAVFPNNGARWDGKSLVVAVYSDTYRYVKHKQIGHVQLKGDVRPTFWIQGATAISASWGNGISLWSYPQGGHYKKFISNPDAYGVTVSLARR